MLKARHKDLHPLLKVAEWLLIMVISVLIVLAVWHILPINHASIGSLLLFQALQAIGLFIVPALVVAYLWSEQPLPWLKINHRPLEWQPVLLSVGIIITAVPLINCLVSWNRQITLPESMHALEQLMQQMEQQADRLLQGFLTYQDGAWWVLLLNLIILAILPAIGEELTFRGVLQGLLSSANGQKQKAKGHIAVWVTAFVFSFVHFQFYGFVVRLLLGAVLGYALLWSGRIQYSMIMHATNNMLSVLVFYLGTYVWNMTQEEIDALGTDHTWWLTLICTPLMCVQLYLLYKRSSAHHHLHPQQ